MYEILYYDVIKTNLVSQRITVAEELSEIP